MNTAYKLEPQVDAITLPQGVFTIGRAKTNDMVIPLRTVSARHAKITTFFDAAYIHDLGSTNGTFVNGRQVNQGILRPGDHIHMGDYQFIIAGFKPK